MAGKKEDNVEEKVDTILINQLFAGSYLSEGYNIGHEVINLFQADDGKNYIYVAPYGTVTTDKNVEITDILFVQNISGGRTMDVIMKAEGVHKFEPEKELDNVCYAETKLKDIFNDNIHHGENDSQKIETFVTFKADSVKFPKKNTRIILKLVDQIENDKNDYVSDSNEKITTIKIVSEQKDENSEDKSKKLVGQSMKSYIFAKSYPVTYKTIKEEVIDKEELWDDTNLPEKLNKDDPIKSHEPTFLSITKKEYDELVFSNLLAYYIKKAPDVFIEFAEKVLGIEGFSPKFDVVRESKNNIDIWIEDENNVIVIENKIKSKLNGKAKGEKDPDIKTQLDKYYKYTKKHCKENGKKSAFFIFTPNHNLIDRGESTYDEKYEIITYKQIYEFLDRNKTSYENDKYFNDFLNGLKLHTNTLAEMRLDIMKNRFLEKTRRR